MTRMSSSTKSRGRIYNLCEQVEGGLGSVPKVFLFKPSYNLNVSLFSIERAQLAMTETHPNSFFSDWFVLCAKGVVPQFTTAPFANDTNNMNLQVE
jgi:hypothetical protein